MRLGIKAFVFALWDRRERARGSLSPCIAHIFRRAIGQTSMKMKRVISVALAVLFLAAGAVGQVAPPSATDHPTTNCDRPALNTYLLGPDDELETSGLEPDEPTSKSTRIDGDGAIQVPLVGRVHVAGLTVEQAEHEVNNCL